MISPAFLFRVASFVLSLALVAACVIVVWLAFTYLLRLTVDALASSNRGFVVWARGKWPLSVILRKKVKQ